MPTSRHTLANTDRSFGLPARVLHWLTALLILAAIPLGVIANGLPFDSSEALAAKAGLFSLHKTVGIAAFAVAVLRILWALTQRQPAPVDPARRAETRLAALVHWLLYLSLVAVPLSGWVHHAATTGFAPILWPLPQGLAFVPQSGAVASAAGAVHWLFTKLLIAAIALHVAGALKHALIDRDGTLSRMLWGRPAGPGGQAHPGRLAAPVIAVAILAAGAVGAVQSTRAPASEASAAGEVGPGGAVVPAPAASTAPADPWADPWTVTEGTLGLTVAQLGQAVSGSFPNWTADIRFSPAAVDGRHGRVRVEVAVTALALGSVSQQARGPEFLDAAGHPVAVFDAVIEPGDGEAGATHLARGSLTLRGVSVPVVLPFTLGIAGDTAQMRGALVLDRRDFGIGARYGDEATVGFAVTVEVGLSARRGG